MCLCAVIDFVMVLSRNVAYFCNRHLEGNSVWKRGSFARSHAWATSEKTKGGLFPAHRRFPWLSALARRASDATRKRELVRGLPDFKMNISDIYTAREQPDPGESCNTQVCLKGLCHGSPFHFVLFCQLYSPSIAIELKVGKEITCKWQNQRLETNKYVPWALFLKLQSAEINFENC